jgi:drug/metabolite transporter (DMT)-like permease
MTVGAAACSGLYFVIQRPLVVKLGTISAAACTMLAGGLLLVPWSIEGLSIMATNHAALRAILYLALAASVGGYALWMVALRSLGATRAAMFLFLMAPLTGLIEAIGRRVMPSINLILGGALTIFGVTLASAKSPLRTVGHNKASHTK